jgi:hypothetical protein
VCDPLIEFEVSQSYISPVNEFSKETVDEYLKQKEHFTKYPLRHYSQLETHFSKNIVKELMIKLGIPINGITATVFAGYTGQFALCLRDVGMHVIFTDPLSEWVKNAANNQFEAYRYSTQFIPSTIIRKTELFATFEGYPALEDFYTGLRFLTVPYGILFAESKKTRKEMDEKEPGPGLKHGFLAYYRTYSIKRIFREKEDLRFYHFCANETQREYIKIDCKVIKDLFSNLLNEKNIIDRKVAILCAERTGIELEKWLHSLERIWDLLQPRAPRHLMYLSPPEPNTFQIYSKKFKIDRDLLGSLGIDTTT